MEYVEGNRRRRLQISLRDGHNDPLTGAFQLVTTIRANVLMCMEQDAQEPRESVCTPMTGN